MQSYSYLGTLQKKKPFFSLFALLVYHLAQVFIAKVLIIIDHIIGKWSDGFTRIGGGKSKGECARCPHGTQSVETVFQSYTLLWLRTKAGSTLEVTVGIGLAAGKVLAVSTRSK